MRTFILIVLIAVVIIGIAVASRHRRTLALDDQRRCRACGTSNPEFAAHCRHCGEPLG